MKAMRIQELFVVFILIFETTHCVELPDNACKTSLETVTEVSNCSSNEKEYKIADRKNNCSRYNHDCRSFQYHCVLNEWTTSLVEVCAPSILILSEKCTEFNRGLQSIRESYLTDCKKISKPCPLIYNSTQSFLYPACYDTISTTTKRYTESPTVKYKTTGITFMGIKSQEQMWEIGKPAISNQEKGPLKSIPVDILAQQLGVSLSSIKEEINANDLLSDFDSRAKEVLDNIAPLRTITIKGESLKPWYNDSIHEARQRRRQLERKATRSGLEEIIVMCSLILESLHCVELPYNACNASLDTLTVVSYCPSTDEEYRDAARRKNCSKYSHPCKSFEYHCVLNEWTTNLVEVCAPSILILSGKCSEFNRGLQSIRESYLTDCKRFSKPCPSVYNSTRSFLYPACYDTISTTTKRYTESPTVKYKTTGITFIGIKSQEQMWENGKPAISNQEKGKKESSDPGDVLKIALPSTIVPVLIVVVIIVLKHIICKRPKQKSKSRETKDASNNPTQDPLL